MNTLNALRIAVACAAAFCAGVALADTTADQAQGSTPAQSPSQDVGGVPSTTSASGAPMGITRAQVYQDLVHSEQSGESASLQKNLYHGQ